MQHGSRCKTHKLDKGWLYSEFRWASHHWSKRGLISGRSRYALRWYKRQFARGERRRGKLQIFEEFKTSNLARC